MKKLFFYIKDKINLIINKFRKFKDFDEKYKISLYSTSISFYMVIASFSLLNIFIGILGKYLENIDSYVLSKLIEIFEYFEYYKYFSLNTSSLIFIISIIWSSSKVINGYNKVSDLIYNNVKRRNGWYLRFSSFVMFSFLLVILLIELIINVFLQKILNILIINTFLFRIVEFSIEILIIYIIIVLLYIYAPPNYMKYKDVKKGAIISASLLYLVIILLILIYAIIGKYLRELNFNNSIVLIISTYLLALFVCNYIIILGLIINSKNYKFLKSIKRK